MGQNKKLDDLIKSLSQAVSILVVTADKWRLFRSLVNVREPLPVDDVFLQVQEELLKNLIAQKGVTDSANLQPVQDNIDL